MLTFAINTLNARPKLAVDRRPSKSTSCPATKIRHSFNRDEKRSKFCEDRLMKQIFYIPMRISQATENTPRITEQRCVRKGGRTKKKKRK